MAIKINTTIMKELLSLLTKINMIIEKSNNGEGQDESVLTAKRKIAEYASFSIANKRLDINTFFSTSITHMMLGKYLDLVGASLVDKQMLLRMKNSIDKYCTVVLKSVKPSMELNRIYNSIMENGSFDISTVEDIVKILNDAQNGKFNIKETSIEEEVVVENDKPERVTMQNGASTHLLPPITGEDSTISLDSKVVFTEGKKQFSKTIEITNDSKVEYVTEKDEPKVETISKIDMSRTVTEDNTRKVVTPIQDSNMTDEEFFKHGIRKIIKAITEYVPCKPTGEGDATMIADGLYVDRIITYSEPKFTQSTLHKIKWLISDESLTPEQVIDLSTMVSMYVKKIKADVFTKEELQRLKDRAFDAMALVY